MFIYCSNIVEFRKACVLPTSTVSLTDSIVSCVYGKDPILVVALGIFVNCPNDTTGYNF